MVTFILSSLLGPACSIYVSFVWQTQRCKATVAIEPEWNVQDLQTETTLNNTRHLISSAPILTTAVSADLM